VDPSLRNFIRHFIEDLGLHPDKSVFEPLRGDGSRRLFWRITCLESEQSFIAMSNPPVDSYARKENLAYIRIGNHLKSKSIPVPQIYVFKPENGWVIMEDMGRTRLQDALAAGQDPIPIYSHVIELLLHLQLKGAEGFDVRWCCQTPYYDSAVMRKYESDYFTGAFLGLYMGLNKERPELETSFEHIAEMASRSDSRFFLFRDFQSRNILLDSNQIGFVDWQGGRLGPLGYDLASLLIDPYTALSSGTQDEIFHMYFNQLKQHDSKLAGELKRDYPYLALQRNLQILGAFAHLSKVQDKGYFEAYIPSAMNTLTGRLQQIRDPELSPLKALMVSLIERNFDSTSHCPQDKITVHAPGQTKRHFSRKKS